MTRPPLPTRPDGAPWRNLHGRRRGKALRPAQRRHLEQTLPKVCVPNVGWADNSARVPVDLPGLFARRAPLILEIGFGAGEHLLHCADHMPDHDFIGCEPYMNGVAALLPRLAARRVGNVRVHPGDARDLLDVLPAASVDICYLLYPDPWPKRRHQGRRFVQPDTIAAMARAVRPGGELRVATDIADYARHVLATFRGGSGFDWMAERPSDWRDPWPGFLSTRYEIKARRAGRRPTYLRYRRAD